VSDLTGLFDTAKPRTTAVEATVAVVPADPDGDMYVTVEAFDGKRQRWGPVRWIPGSVIPNRGDTCLLVFDEVEQPWAILTDQVLANVGMDADATTLAAGSAATAEVDEVDPNQFMLHLGIPKGDKGDPGGPVGAMFMWPTATPPTGFLICDGSTFSAATYPALAAVLGTTTLPDMRQRMPVGAGSVLALGANEGLAAASRHPKHHHHTTANVNSVADHTHPGVADHTHPNAGTHDHPSAGAHSHSTGQGNEFATTVENTGTRGTSSTTFTLVSGGINATDTQGAHQHGNAGDHTHGAAGGHTHGAAGAHFHTLDADTTGGGPADSPSYLAVNFIIRAL